MTDVSHNRQGPDALTVAALIVVVVSSISTVGLAVDRFRPGHVMPMSLGLSGLLWWWWAGHRFWRDETRAQRPVLLRRQHGVLALVLAVAAFLRFPPFFFSQGGQDPGLYVTMAAELKRWGRLKFPDPFRAGLADSLRSVYDLTHLYSYYLVDGVKSLNIVEFYPLHPALMSISMNYLGGTGRAAMLAISMLGVWVSWHLALAIDGRRIVSLIFSLFIAVNPALVFFAKYPVSESTALTFVLIGMLFLIRFMRSTSKRDVFFNLLVAVGSFNALFYVRWQFLLYVPFFAVLLLGSAVLKPYQRNCGRIALFLIPTLILFWLSMVFYRMKLPELYQPVRDSVYDMLPKLSTHWWTVTILVATVVLLMIHMLSRTSWFWRFSESSWIERLSGWVLVGALALSWPSLRDLSHGKSMYPWGYTPPAATDDWVFRFHALYRIGLFISPWLLLIVSIHALVRPARNRLTALAHIFIGLCWIGILLRPYVPYLYYYGRYLAVDATPGLLLLGAIALGNLSEKRFRLGSWAVTGVTLLYFGLFAIVQIGGNEGNNKKFFSRLSREFDRQDVLVVSSVSQQVMVPLRSIYGMAVTAVPQPGEGIPTQAEVLSMFGREATRRGGTLYFLGGEGPAPPGMKSVGVFTFSDSFITNTDHFRGGGLQNLTSKRRLLLPTVWQTNSFNWELFVQTG